MAAHRPVLITNYSPNFNRLASLQKSKPMGQIFSFLLVSAAESLEIRN
jgi:hypothetical protein